ncbi:MAG: ABC transporter substrate-binding protein [Thermomicrobiales bacterium]
MAEQSQAMTRRELLHGAAVAGISASALGGVLRAEPSTAAPLAQSGSGVLQLGGESEAPGVWFPFRASGGVETQVFDLIFSRLVRFDAGYNLIPDLAERFEISDDATRFTFYLRQDVTWSDGTPFTARDVMFTYRLAMRQESGARQYGKLSQVAGAAPFYEGETDELPGLEMPDDYTFRITLEQPNVAFLIGSSHTNSLIWIVPEHVLADMNPAEIDQHPFSQQPTVGTGPFSFVEYVPDQYVQVKNNPSYFLGVPKLAEAFVRVSAPATQLAQLETGELHVMQAITARDAERLQDHELVDIQPMPGIGIFQTAIMNERFPDKRVRQAFMYGIDRQALMDVVLRGQGRLVTQSVIGPEWARYDDLNMYEYDPERAKQLLAEAEWDASRIVALIWPQGYQDIETAAPVVQQQLKEVGIEIELKPMDEPAFEKLVVEDAEFDLAWFGGGAYGLDPDVSSTYYACANWTPNGGNTTHYCNEELDALLVEGRGTPDVARRTATYHQVAQILNEDVPTIFWWSENMIWGISKKLQGVKPGANTDIHWNVHEWSLTE